MSLTAAHTSESASASSAARARPWLIYLFIAIVLGVAAWQYGTAVNKCWGAWGVDYTKHWLAGERVLRGETPYQGELPDNYPAPTKPLFMWLMLFDIHMGEVMWDVWNALMIAGAAAMAAIFYRPRPSSRPLPGAAESANLPSLFKILLRRAWWAWGIMLVCSFTPAVELLHSGNVAPTSFFLLVMWGAFEARGRAAWSGAGLVMGSLTKVMTIFALWPYIIGWRRRALIGAGIVLGLYILSVTLAGWWAWEWHMYSVILPGFTWEFTGISYGVNILLGQTIFPWAMAEAGTFRLYSTVVGGVFIAITMLGVWLGRRRLASEEGHLTAVSLCLIALPLIDPMLEYHHYIWIIPAWLWLWRRWVEGALDDTAFLAQIPGWFLIIAAAWWGDLTGRGYWPALAGAFYLWILIGFQLLRLPVPLSKATVEQ